MKCVGKIAIFFVSGLVLNTGLCASRGPSSNPYELIVTRNVFGLNPPRAINTTPAPPRPPSKITPDGIMTIFGTPQVLFKVAVPPRPPKPATDKSYILSEGQQQDDIEVKHIDVKNGIVTFSNHGIVQEIPLVKAGPISTPTPVVMRTGSTPPGMLRHIPLRGGNTPNLGGRFGQNRNFGSTAGNGNTTPGNYGGSPVNSTGAGPAQPPLSPEEQMIMIAAQHAEYQKEGNPLAKIMPPTPLDEAAGVIPTTPKGGQQGSQ